MGVLYVPFISCKIFINATKISGGIMKCIDCGFTEGTLLKQFQEAPEQNYSWYELSEMTEVCASCGSENIKLEKGE